MVQILNEAFLVSFFIVQSIFFVDKKAKNMKLLFMEIITVVCCPLSTVSTSIEKQLYMCVHSCTCMYIEEEEEEILN